MDSKLLKPYQIEAVNAIQTALTQSKKCIVVEMVSGSGKVMILGKTLEYLQKTKNEKILIVTDYEILKEQLQQRLDTNFEGLIKIDNYNISLETNKNFLIDLHKKASECDIIIFYDINISTNTYNTLLNEEKTFIVIYTKDDNILHDDKSLKKFNEANEIVYSYSIQDALIDGYMTPAMDTSALEPAIQLFSKNLLKQFGYSQSDSLLIKQDQMWDLILKKDKQRIFVEYKYYKSQVVSPSIASDLLKTVIKKNMKQNFSNDDIFLLIVFSNIPFFQKDEIFNRYRIIVWDIENLVFYCKNNPKLFKQLSQITYFSIDQIEGQPSKEAEKAYLLFDSIEDKSLNETEEGSKNTLLIQKLTNCAVGRDNSREFEEICEEILRYLFEANYFNRLTSQHKTDDEHFRMDLIGSLKITQKNDESMHPLWNMLVQHYNSHFVVFEFKNYAEKIDQNLIYITEKYLFNAALRNVAFIISREGFSSAAEFAAKGCLKEHGKLIIDINQDDLLKMLKSPDDNPADYLLAKLEDFLMGISK